MIGPLASAAASTAARPSPESRPAPTPSAAEARDAPRAQVGPGAPAAAEPAAAAVGAPETPDAVRQATSRAAEALFRGREVRVDSRYDEATDRAVYRIADGRTGEVLFESPPEELLRFFASSREPAGAPLVALEA